MIEVKNVKLDTEVLDKFAANLGTNTDGALRSVALQVAAYAKDRAPKKTRALANSIDVEPKGNNTYWVQDGVEYGIFQELGTSKMKTPHPFMVPATINAVRDLIEAVKKAYEK